MLPLMAMTLTSLDVEWGWIDQSKLKRFLREARTSEGFMQWPRDAEMRRNIEVPGNIYTPEVSEWIRDHCADSRVELRYFDDLTTFTLKMLFADPRIAVMFKCKWAEGATQF